MSDKRHRGPKRTPVQRAADLARIAELHLRGHDQASIAAILGDEREYSLSRSQVGYDIRKLKAMWLESALVDFDEARAQELARVAHLERTYWEAWERSCEEVAIETTSAAKGAGGADRVSKTKRVEPGLGDARWLAGVQWCIEKRCQILGLDAPVKSEQTGGLRMVVEYVNDWRGDGEHTPTPPA